MTTLARGGEAGARIMVAVVVIGMVIGVINLTGLGLRFSNAVMSLGEASLFLSLAVAMLASLVLGMGLPTLPAYLIIVVVIAPALAELGVPAMLSHLFIIYFAALSAITPPVAVAAYSAAPLAGANPLTTAVIAVRLALVGFAIPFAFVFNPSLLLVVDFSAAEAASVLARLALMIWLLATALSGVSSRGALSLASRAARSLVAFALLWPESWVQALAVATGPALVAAGDLPTRRLAAGSVPPSG